MERRAYRNPEGGVVGEQDGLLDGDAQLADVAGPGATLSARGHPSPRLVSTT
jgi:hypothetical protein